MRRDSLPPSVMISVLPVAAVLMAAVFLLAPMPTMARPLHELRLDVWTADHGLPHNTVLSLAQTRDGFLWIGTWEGLVRFDGSRFTALPATMPAALRESGILSLAAADDGSLWVGTHGGGIYRVHAGQHRQFSAPGKDLREHVIALLVTRDNDVYAGTSGGSLLRRQGDGFVAIAERNASRGGGLFGLAQGRDGQIIAASDTSLLRVEQNSSQVLNVEWPQPQPLVSRVYPRRDGGFWLATSLGLYWLDGDLETPHRVDFDAAVSRALEEPDGTLWLASDPMGLVQLSAGQPAWLSRNQGLPNTRVAALLRDLEGDLWIGTNGGLAHLHAAPFAAVTERQGLPDAFVRAVLQRRDGSLVAGSAAGLTLLRDGQVLSPPADWANLPADVSVLALAETTDARLLVGTSAHGAFEIGPGIALLRSAPEHLSGPQVRAILADVDGGIWYGSTRGLSHCQGRQCRQFTRADGLAGDYITALFRDRRGQLWVGSSLGVARQRDDGFETVAIGDDAARSVFAFLEDRQGRLWLSSDGGIGLLHEGRFHMIEQRHGLPGEAIFAVLQDQAGSLWLSSNRGVMRIEFEAALAVIQGRAERLDGRRFTRADGLPSNQINGGSQPSALRAEDGRLWFASAGGLASIRPDDALIDAAPPAPRAALEAILADGDELEWTAGEVRIEPDQRRLQFRFTGISFTAPSRLQLRYRLRGFEEAWQLAGAERVAGYSNLRPARYRFELEAGWPEQPGAGDRVAVDVVVLPAWFERIELQVLGALVLIALLLLGLRLRVRALHDRAHELECEVAKQTFDLTAERDALSQANRRNVELLLRLGQQASEDSLTGLANRRRADLELAQSLAAPGAALQLALIDIDDFKRINDRFGHSVGDQVLQRFAQQLRASTGDTAFCARVGGEEFLVLWRDQDVDVAHRQLSAVRNGLIETNWIEIATGLAVRFCAGIATRQAGETADSLYRRADQALYRAKQGGRDRIERATARDRT